MATAVSGAEIYHTDYGEMRRLWSYRITWAHGGTYTSVGHDSAASCTAALHAHLLRAAGVDLPVAHAGE